MRRRSVQGLSIDKGQYVKSVGYCLSKGGRLTARRWYLGPVEAEGAGAAALVKAALIREAWRAGIGVKETTIDGHGVRVWADDANPLAERPREAVNATGEASGVGPRSEGGGLTVGQARDQYLAGIKRRFDAGAVSHAYWSGESFNLARGVALLGEGNPLASIGAAEVEAAVLTLASRPLAKSRKGQTAEPKRLSVKSAKSYLASLRAFLNHLASTERAPGSDEPLWRKPLRFDSIFDRNQPELSPQELDARLRSGKVEPDAFSLAELRAIIEGAPDRQRLWVLLALNCGFSNMELATLTVGQIQGLNTDSPLIRRYRNKTGVYAQWKLWPETAELLARFIERDRRKGDDAWAVVTADGQTLIEPRGMGRRDAVRAQWLNVVKVLPEARRLGFKFVRKAGAKLIRHMGVGGSEVAEMYLSHADNGGDAGQTQLPAYAGRAWDKLAAALVELRRMLFDGWQPPPIRKRKRGKGKTQYVELSAEPLAK